ncbi:hypothetical protein D3273_09235 [Lichenibacterium minor]|uniref:Uncharacterized protein n=1 Tax=Lichenibacterium minor TaxID=2316528 RepID=A0A4Q2U8H0_9HYPH|nr:hypothetical protein [Lichenibacterium minor]RYC32208.1 hypothetical protein D3273_09235 [Lichenibacterium minor]
MPKRKVSAVSLAGAAPVARGHEDATPERLARAREDGDAAVDRAGVRRIGDPFDALRSRNLLDRLDIAANETLWHAGDRLRRHWHLSRLGALTAVDLARPCVDGGGGGSGGPGEAAQRHRDAFRRAVDAVGPRLMPYVAGVVIAGAPVASLRGLVGDSAHARTADALALERLREGLHRLCELWRMRPEARPLPIASWRAAGAEAVPDPDARG